MTTLQERVELFDTHRKEAKNYLDEAVGGVNLTETQQQGLSHLKYALSETVLSRRADSAISLVIQAKQIDTDAGNREALFNLLDRFSKDYGCFTSAELARAGGGSSLSLGGGPIGVK